MRELPANQATKVVVEYLSQFGEVALVAVNDWEQQVATADSPLFLVQPGRTRPLAQEPGSITELSISVWCGDSTDAADISTEQSKVLNRTSLINQAGWIRWIEITSGVERLDPPNDRVEGFGFLAEAKTYIKD